MTKTSHLAFDVHAATIALGLLDEGAAKPEVWEIANEPAAIRKAVQRVRKGRELRCCYEAGPCGYVLQRQLTAMGISCDVIAPSLIPRKPGDRVKTDRRDAARLAKLHRAGELTAIGVPTEDQEAVRDLVRAREDARRSRTDARHRLTKFLLRQGLRFPASNWTVKFWVWVKSLSFARPEQAKGSSTTSTSCCTTTGRSKTWRSTSTLSPSANPSRCWSRASAVSAASARSPRW